MELVDKAKIVVEFVQQFNGEEDFNEFFDYNDLGIPMAIMIVNELVTPTDQGMWTFDETYNELCAIFGASPLNEYESLQDMIDEES